MTHTSIINYDNKLIKPTACRPDPITINTHLKFHTDNNEIGIVKKEKQIENETSKTWLRSFIGLIEKEIAEKL